MDVSYFKTFFEHDFIDRSEKSTTFLSDSSNIGRKFSIANLIVDILILSLNTN